jgi:hypothetical protein
MWVEATPVAVPGSSCSKGHFEEPLLPNKQRYRDVLSDFVLVVQPESNRRKRR